ncbi:1384_t:CDS:2 [Rhizophagus irregularis]|nr:1384_t:CDS:2 [Rhizophagus irregularis]
MNRPVPIVLLIFVVLLPCSSNIIATYYENDTVHDNYFKGVYADGTILIGVRFKGYPNNTISLRLIYPNGTLNFINNVTIPCNTCDPTKYNPSPLNPNYIIIWYEKSGMIMDWTGNIITSKITQSKCDKFEFVMNERSDRFLIAGYNETSQNILFAEYFINNDGTIGIKAQKNLTFNGVGIKNIIEFKIFLLGDIWGIIYKVDLEEKSEYIYNKKDAFFSLIHNESQNRNLNPSIIKDISFIGVSCISNDINYTCIYVTSYNNTLKLIDINNLTLNNTFNMRSIDLFPFINIYKFESISSTANIIHIIPEIGFLVEVVSNAKTKYLIFNTAEIDYFDTTIKIIRAIKRDKSFTYESTDLTTIIPKNNLLNNIHIKQVYPSENDLIEIYTDKMNMTFLNPIDPTIPVYISIYHYHNYEDILRQKFLCTMPFCTISEDSYSLIINLSSNVTFNIPNASYYVEIEDNFVEYKYEIETVPGIKKPKSWNIYTASEYKHPEKDNNDFIIGILRLNPEGTQEFSKLDKNGRNEFFKFMKIDLSKGIPVDDSRIYKVDDIYEHDIVTDSELLLISYRIDLPGENCFNKKSAKEIYDDLNSLIRNDKFITYLDTSNYTKNIDKGYGFQRSSNLWEEIKISLHNFVRNTVSLIILMISTGLIIILYFFGRYKNRMGSNIIILRVALIIFDLFNDIGFVILLEDDLQYLYVPSVIFLLIPFILNILLAFIIFSHEIQYPEFNKWLKKYLKPVAIITFFSSGDVELLHIFDSKFGGFQIFEASFSPLAIVMTLIGIIEYGYHLFINKNIEKEEIEFYDETDEIKISYDESKM